MSVSSVSYAKLSEAALFINMSKLSFYVNGFPVRSASVTTRVFLQAELFIYQTKRKEK